MSKLPSRDSAVRLCLSLLFLGLIGLSPKVSFAAVCGDSFCEGGENTATCYIDCGICGDLTCDSFESVSECPQDCGPCGDLRCDGGEDASSCPEDCTSVCGDSLCDPGENCAEDCGSGGRSCDDIADCQTDDICLSSSCDLNQCQHVSIEGCQSCALDSDCNDGDACNGSETCNPNLGCQPAEPLNCDDGDVCTADRCDPNLGCSHTNPNGSGEWLTHIQEVAVRDGESCPCRPIDKKTPEGKKSHQQYEQCVRRAAIFLQQERCLKSSTLGEILSQSQQSSCGM